MQTDKTLFYIFHNKGDKFSTHPDNSDFLQNNQFMDQVVGTLLKIGPTGKREPYLAEYWEIKDNGKKWHFHLKKDLVAEDDTKINASNYTKGLEHLLRWQFHNKTKSSHLPCFSNLHGWLEFLETGNFNKLGIRAIGDYDIEFEFSVIPDDFLFCLIEPYLGFFSLNNFDSKGNWKSNEHVISSAAYKIKRIDVNSEVVLEKRKGWFSLLENTANTVILKLLSVDEIVKLPAKKTIIYKGMRSIEPKSSGFIQVISPPDVLVALVLSPRKEGIFKNKENRQKFLKRINTIKRSIDLEKFGLQNTVFTETLYPTTTPVKQDLEKTPEDLKFENNPIVNVVEFQQGVSGDYYMALMDKAFKNTGVKLNYKGIKNTLTGNADKKYLQVFDVFIKVVNVGDVVANSTTKMMFCSDIGVGFPDPSGRVCRLVDEFDQSNKKDIGKYTIDLNTIIADDAAVIPLFHASPIWLYSKDLDLKNISPLNFVPRFDLIELK